MSKLKVLDLFSGWGGFALGLERTGKYETVQFCEKAEFPRKILEKHWPGIPIHDDITTLEYTKPVDLVTAGFPCQDASLAGPGAGISGERTGLFWHVVRSALLVGRPKLLLENVAGLFDRGLRQVLGALTSCGYDCEWDIIPACAVGLPHHRERVWIIAYNREERIKGSRPEALRWLTRVPWSENVRRASNWRERSDLHSPRLCRTSDGVRDRVGRTECAGNSVVPEIPELIGHAILEAEKQARAAA